LKPERWGSPLVQEKYEEEKACDKRHPYRMIIIIIIIIIIIFQCKLVLAVDFIFTRFSHKKIDHTFFVICN